MTNTEESKKRANGSEHPTEEPAADRPRDRQPSRDQPGHAGEHVSSNADEAQKKQDKDLKEGAENPV
ncbi:MAG: hypothetical protein ACR2OE_17550 [Thermomicrobiales bacterium]